MIDAWADGDELVHVHKAMLPAFKDICGPVRTGGQSWRNDVPERLIDVIAVVPLAGE